MEKLALIICITCTMSLARPSDDLVDISDLKNASLDAILNMTKHKDFLSCPKFELDKEDYVIFPNETVYVEAYNMTFNSSFYWFANDTLNICVPDIITKEYHEGDAKYSDAQEIVTHIGLGTSVLCLLLHLVVFAIVPDLRNLPGYNLASLCLALLLGYLTLMIGNGINLKHFNFKSCVTSAFLTHFFFLSSFMWTSVLAMDVYKSLRNATGKLRVGSSHFSIKKFAFYSCYAWGTAFLIAIFAIIVDITEFLPLDYRPQFARGLYCWFHKRLALLIYFATPVFIVTISDVIIFGLSAFTVYSNTLKSDDESQRTVLRNNFKLYSRLAVIMGLTWITGIVASSFDVPWLWYLFILLNTFQGLFIFIAFTCASKVRKYFRELLHLDNRRASAWSLNPTFQTYCNYTNSVDKDLNNAEEINTEKTEVCNNGVIKSPEKTDIVNNGVKNNIEKTGVLNNAVEDNTEKTGDLYNVAEDNTEKTAVLNNVVENNTEKTAVLNSVVENNAEKTGVLNSVIENNTGKTEVLNSVVENNTEKTEILNIAVETKTEKTAMQ